MSVDRAVDPPVDAAVVVAVIACLEPRGGLVQVVVDLLQQVEAVVVVDDGSVAAADVFAALEAAGASVVHQPNAGIAAALNAGIDVARRRFAPEFVLTLDQDSRPASDYVERAVGTWREATRRGVAVAFVAAESYSGRRAPTDGVVHGLARAFDPMQSGWVVPVSTFDAVGALEEDLVIDGVDSEFTIRCRTLGLDPVVAPGCALEHGQGERLPAVLLGHRVALAGRPLSWNRHAPVRVYYMARNGTLLTRRHLLAQPRWVLRRLGQETQAHLLRLAFSPDRALLARAIAAGWRDGLAGRPGRIAPALERRLGG